MSSNVDLTYGKDQISWRRSKVLELSSQGYSQHEIAQTLQVASGTVNSDLSYLRRKASENIQRHIHETIPEEYQKCMTGIKRNLKQTLEIAESTADPRIKLQARALANDCYKYIMELTTDGVVISDAMKYVESKASNLRLKLNTAAMVADSEQQLQNTVVEAATETHNGIF